jgi:hypothetical protein
MIGLKSAPSAPDTPEQPQEQKSFLDKFKSAGKDVSNMVGIGNKNELDPSFLAEIKKLETTFADIDAFKIANPDKLPDVMKEVSELGSLTGYSEAALINALVIHNTAFKMRQLDPGTFGCTKSCAERAQSIRVALRELVKYSERSDALGYIGIGRGVVNNASYVANSTVSAITKAPERLSSAANYAESNARSAYNAFTRRVAPQTTPETVTPQLPQSGGRRRRTRRRRQ